MASALMFQKGKKNLLQMMTVYELSLVQEYHWVTETWTDWQWLSAATGIIIMSWESHWCMHMPSSACMREAKDDILVYVPKRLDLYSIKGTPDRTIQITCCSLSYRDGIASGWNSIYLEWRTWSTGVQGTKPLWSPIAKPTSIWRQGISSLQHHAPSLWTIYGPNACSKNISMNII